MARYLIVVDMQNDFISGSLGSKEAIKIVDFVKHKVKEFDGNVIFTRDTHTKDYLNTQEGKKLPVMHCLQGTQGWELEAGLKETAKEMESLIFDKPAFGSLELAKYLKQENEKEHIEKIEIIGLCTDICVISNAMLLKAFLPEIKIVVDEKCCAGVTKESHQTALSAMKMCQIDIE